MLFDDLQEENNCLSISLEACQTKLRRTQTPLELRAMVKQDVEDYITAEHTQSVSRVQRIYKLLAVWHTGKDLICRAVPSHWVVDISACNECDTCCVSSYACLICITNRSGNAVQCSAVRVLHIASPSCCQGDFMCIWSHCRHSAVDVQFAPNSWSRPATL